MTTTAQATSVETHDNPFPGLRPFDANENHLFFGRDGQSDEILTSLRRNRFVAVVGTSGSGKSSLIRAGLLPLLHGGFMAQASSSWRIALFRPGSDPIGNLARALNRPDVLRTNGSNLATDTVITETTLRRGGLGLIEAVRQSKMPPQSNLLIVVDQFEELFRFRGSRTSESADDDAAFVKLIIEATRQTDLPIYVVITMRSDFIGDCARFRELPETINRGLYLIPLMTRDQRRQAITGPAAVAGTEIAPRLINRVLNDAGESPEQLPLLQHALMRTWADWKTERKSVGLIDLESYEAVGGMEHALSQHADEAFDELPTERSKEIAEKLFRALAEKGPDNREVRRPTRVAEIAAIADASEAEVIAVIEAFRQPGRSFLMPPPEVELNSQSLIDVSHESLIRGWRRLRDWVESEALSAAIYRRVAETAALYEAGQAGLWHDPDLQVALGWQLKTNPNQAWGRRYHSGFPAAMNFLAESVADRDRESLLKEKQRVRELRRIRVFAAVLAVLLILAFASLVLAMNETRKARKQEVRANEEAARASKEAARATQFLGRANDEAAKANQQRSKAEQQSTIAEQKTDEANTQKERADHALAKANSTNLALLKSQKDLDQEIENKTTAEERAKDNTNFAVHSHFSLVVAFDSIGDETKKTKDALTFYDTLLKEGIAVSDKSLDLDEKNREALVLQALARGALPDLHRLQANPTDENSAKPEGEGSPKLKEEMERKLAKVREECEEYEKQAIAQKKSSDAFQRTLGAFLLVQLAEVRIRLADTSDKAKAADDVRNAEEIANAVGPALESTDEWNWRLLSLTYEGLGKLRALDETGDPIDIIRDYQKAAQARTNAVQALGKGDFARIEAYRYLLYLIQKVAELQLKSDEKASSAKAISEYKTQLIGYEQTVQAYPSDLNTRSVASMYRRLATLERDAGDLAATRDATDQQIRILKPFAARAGATRDDKRLLADAYGSRSWYDLFLGDFQDAILDAQTGLSYDNTETWIHTNEAHGYLFLKKTEEARAIYLENLDKRDHPNDVDPKTFGEAILGDFDEFRQRRVPQIDLSAIDDIEKRLAEDPVKGWYFRRTQLSHTERIARDQIQKHQNNKSVSYAEAINTYKTHLKAYEEAVRAHPSDEETRFVASVYRRLATLQWEAQDPAATRDATDQQIRVLKPLATRPGATPEDKTLLAKAYGSRSWYDLFLGNFEEAISDAKTGLSYDDKEIWIHTNEAHGYLFLKKTDLARKIYLEYAHQRAFPSDSSMKTFLTGVLEDFKDFRQRGIPNVNLQIIDNIEAELRTMQAAEDNR
jgi:energy-coupling factor transporter ATP-binding protein EcfA2